MRQILSTSALGVLLSACVFGAVGCDNDVEPMSSAGVVASRGQLIGGTRGLGELGDYVLENSRVRAVIQAPGYSRGFGVYGGSLIDASRKLPNQTGNSYGANGQDQLGELFPAFFLQATAVDSVTVINDGSNGEAARVRATGETGEFLQMVAFLDRFVNDSNVDFFDPDSTDYVLEPDASHIRIEFTVENLTDEDMSFPSELAQDLLPALGLDGLRVPMGEVALFGKQAKIFMPGIGFDLVSALDTVYGSDISLPNFPGVATEYIATRSEGTSYGMLGSVPEPGDEDRNYIWPGRAQYEAAGFEVSPSSMLVPFTTSGFIGVFYEAAPPVLAAGASHTITKYFIIGDGDVGSVLDEVYAIRGVETGRVAGRLLDPVTSAGTPDAQAFVYKVNDDGSLGTIFTQYDVNDDGTFFGNLEPGNYSLVVTGEGRVTTDHKAFEVRVGETTNVNTVAGPRGRVIVQFVDEHGARVPAKASAVGTYGEEFIGMLPRDFLFDEELGQAFRSTDFERDTTDPETRRYIEGFGFADNGTADFYVRPGTYDIYSSRGPEYDVEIEEDVAVEAGQVVRITHTLRRVIDTEGWIAADFHIHSEGSIDSGYKLDERVRALAAEGVEWAVSTDHNYITDFTPYITRAGLNNWLGSSIGLELTTLESGHFNGYPLAREVGPTTHGAIEWSGRTPDELFANLRSLGAYGPENTIVQVNHPRDTIIGYFNQYERSGLTGNELPGFCPDVGDDTSVLGLIANLDNLTAVLSRAFCDAEMNSTYSDDFDALEILNGKLFWQIHHFRMPPEDELPPGDYPDDLPQAGSIIVDEDCDLSACTVEECACEVEFPGAIDDWYNLLNTGKRYIGIGTSDSHSSGDESGYFRSMIYVGEGNDRAPELHDLDIVRGLRSRRMVATNGPMLDFSINDATTGVMGSTIVDTDGQVELTINLQAANWVGASIINVVRNGVLIRTITIDSDRDLETNPIHEVLTLDLAQDDEGNPIDSWFVVETFGEKSFFPVVTPAEVPPTSLDQAIGVLAGPLGFGGAPYGDLEPSELFQFKAYAMTNPIWVQTAGGRDFIAPGVVAPISQMDESQASGFQTPVIPEKGLGEGEVPANFRLIGQPGESDDEHAPRAIFDRQDNSPYDIRSIFSTFGGGAHGH